MPRLHFSKEHEALVKLLTSPVSEELPALFPEYRDLMLFAAMVGKNRGRKKERVGNGGEVDSEYIASRNFNKEGVVFLLGLLDYEDPEVLKDGAEKCWRLFEEYCAGGMDEMAEWLKGASDMEECADTLLGKLAENARSAGKKPVIVVKPKGKLHVE